MAVVRKPRRLTNPSRRKRGRRKLSAKQIRYFGTKQQKAALRAKRRNTAGPHRKRKRNVGTSAGRSWSRAAPRSSWPKRASKTKRKAPKRKGHRRRNISEIVTFPLAGLGLNPGGKMARPRKRRKTRRAGKRHGYNAKRRNPGYRRYHTRRHHRRNPGIAGIKGLFGDALSVIGGAVACKYATQLVLRGNNMGVVGYVGNLVSAFVLGWGSKKVFKSEKIGTMVTLGGITALALRLLQDLTPVGKFVNLSLSGLGRGGDIGLGIIVPSSFYTPQVPLPGSMTSFVTPSAISQAIAAGMPVGRSGLRGMGNDFAGRTARGVVTS